MPLPILLICFRDIGRTSGPFRENLMVLLLSLVLALIPLLGVVWIVIYGSPLTVDGLFTSLILLAMSGILGMNVIL